MAIDVSIDPDTQNSCTIDSATMFGADTTTTPVGREGRGKKQFEKDLTAILGAHGVPCVAQGSPSYWNDLITKMQKALNTDGPSFINVLAPCRLGWAFPPEDTIEMGRLAANTCAWPLYEVVDGQYKITYKPREKQPVSEYLKKQTKYRHMFRPGNEAMIEAYQAHVDEKWERLLKLSGEPVPDKA